MCRVRKEIDMNENWLDLDIEKSIYGYEFTKYAVQELNKVISAEDFERMDATMIFDYLSKRMRVVRFNDYLKRYIYEVAGFEEPFAEVPDKLYRDIIVSSFRENNVPFSFTETKTRGTDVVRKWMNRETIKRENIFLLGFGLRMSDEDVSEFLTKAIQEDDFDLFQAREAIFWYCYHHGFGYSKAKTFLNYVNGAEERNPSAQTAGTERVSWDAIRLNPKMYLLNDTQMYQWLDLLREHQVEEKRSDTRYRIFGTLYGRVRRIIAQIYQDYEEDSRSKKVWKPEDITPSDVERSLCSGIPKTDMGNLQKMSKSLLAAQFKNKRMDRQRISRILSRKEDVLRFDLITLLFFIYAEEVEPDWPVERYLQFITEINSILKECNMMGIYPVNPYEAFVLMCLVTDGPLDVYSEVLEKSFE